MAGANVPITEHVSLSLSPGTTPTSPLQSDIIGQELVLQRLAGADKHFMLRAVLKGLGVTVLVDTGATITLISPNLVATATREQGVQVQSCDDITVTLANGIEVVINKRMRTHITIAKITTPITLYVMNLPPQYDLLLGMDWMREHDVWLNPKRKALLMPGHEGITRGHKACAILASVESTVPFYHEIASGATTLDKSVYVCGVDEVEFVPPKEFKRRSMLLQKGKLTQSVVFKEGAPCRDTTPGQSVRKQRAARERVATAKAERAHTHDATGGSTTPKNDSESKEVAFSVDIHVDPKSLPSDYPGIHLEQCSVDATEINRTHPDYAEWVSQVKDGKWGDFACLKERKFLDALKEDEPLRIRLKKDAKPPPPRRYPVPTHLLPHLKEFIDDMLAKGIIAPTNSDWSAPVLIIKKPGVNADGTPKDGYRFVVDLSRANSQFESQQYHIPDIHEMWGKLQGAKWLSLLDLKSGYWLCPLAEESCKYTAFQTPFGSYMYRVVPMGLVSSAAHFQRFVERKLKKYDGVLYSPTIEYSGEDAKKHTLLDNFVSDDTWRVRGPRYRQCQKLTPVYYGPYKIVEVISPVSYRLKLPSTLKIHDVFHVQRLKSASDIEFKGRRRRPAPALPDNVYEVEAIMNDRVRYGKAQYLRPATTSAVTGIAAACDDVTSIFASIMEILVANLARHAAMAPCDATNSRETPPKSTRASAERRHGTMSNI